MTTKEKIQEGILEATKSGNNYRLLALRDVKSAIQVEEKKGKAHELSEAEVISVIQKVVKQHEESMEMFQQAGRDEMVREEFVKKKYLEEYIPESLTYPEMYDAIDNIIKEIHAYTMKDMGNIMKILNERYPNRVDKKEAAAYIKDKLG